MDISWDNSKNLKNFDKHCIWFEEAYTVFSDLNALEVFDSDHSETEDRFILLGLSSLPMLLVVIYCERNENNIRIISARNATNKETKDYEKRI